MEQKRAAGKWFVRAAAFLAFAAFVAVCGTEADAGQEETTLIEEPSVDLEDLPAGAVVTGRELTQEDLDCCFTVCGCGEVNGVPCGHCIVRYLEHAENGGVRIAETVAESSAAAGLLEDRRALFLSGREDPEPSGNF